jgi:hypothetical protein
VIAWSLVLTQRESQNHLYCNKIIDDCLLLETLFEKILQQLRLSYSHISLGTDVLKIRKMSNSARDAIAPCDDPDNRELSQIADFMSKKGIQKWENVNPIFKVAPPGPTVEPATPDLDPRTAVPSLEEFRELKDNHITAFNNVDFADVSDEIINELFPDLRATKQERKAPGMCEPTPKSWKTSAKRIRDWKRLGQKARRDFLDKLKHPEEPDEFAKRRASTKRRRRSRTSSIGFQKRERSPPMENVDDLSAKRPYSPDPALLIQLADHSTHHQPVQLETRTDVSQSISSVACPVPKSPPCCGITLDYFLNSMRSDKDGFAKGYAHLVGEAMHNLGSSISQDHECLLNPTKACGFLMSKSEQERDKITWILKLREDAPPCASMTKPTGINLARAYYTFVVADCEVMRTDGTDGDKNGYCTACNNSREPLRHKIRDELKSRERGVQSNAKLSNRTSPSILRQEVDARQRVLRKFAVQKSRQKQTSNVQKERTSKNKVCYICRVRDLLRVRIMSDQLTSLCTRRHFSRLIVKTTDHFLLLPP